ncbi:MAG TPA: TMEM175 family protein [Pseudonocardiaceae bacterium]|jgi:uncharacterized membrane protein|nr:TMEM175 family protein [Pseudonocardiaceae bacterium]
MTNADPEANTETVEARVISAERLTVFVDAVIAIALTLLALDLPVPSGDTNGAMLRSALDHREEYLAFVISFWVIGAHWNAHHQIFRHVTGLGGRLTSLTMLWLFMQVVTPFATRVITGDGAFQARFGFYSLVQVLADLLFALMLREVQRGKLYDPTTPPGMFRHAYTRDIGMIIGFALSVPVSFLTDYSWVCWIVVPMLTGGTMRRRWTT